MWPGKKGEKEKGGRAMALFEDLDASVENKFQKHEFRAPNGAQYNLDT